MNRVTRIAGLRSRDRGKESLLTDSPAEIRPSPHDRCAECGDAIGDEWVFFRQDPENPQSVLKHFSGIVLARPVEPKPVRPQRARRDLRLPEDLGVFFHSWCGLRAKLPEKVQEEITDLLAKCFVTYYEKMIVRWAKAERLLVREADPPRFRVHVANIEKRRTFAMSRLEWDRLRGHEGQIVEIDLERLPSEGVAQCAATIASLAAECAVESARIEIWPYKENARPILQNVHPYLVLENLGRRVNLAKFAEGAGTHETPALRNHLREHVFIVKERPERGRREAMARALERIVFLTT
jgi:hypothetical protein